MVMFILQMGRIRKDRSIEWKNLSMKYVVNKMIPELHVSFSDHHFFAKHFYLLSSVHDIFQLPALICSAVEEIKEF